MSTKIGVLYGEANACTSGGTRRIEVTRYAGHGPWLQFTPEGNNGFFQVNERELRELLAASDKTQFCKPGGGSDGK